MESKRKPVCTFVADGVMVDLWVARSRKVGRVTVRGQAGIVQIVLFQPLLDRVYMMSKGDRAAITGTAGLTKNQHDEWVMQLVAYDVRKGSFYDNLNNAAPKGADGPLEGASTLDNDIPF